MEVDAQPQIAQEQPAQANPAIATTPAAVLDLNPTGFVDDLCNSVRKN